MINRYTRSQMGSLWSDQNRYATWLEVEIAVCEAWCRLGKISKEDIAEIRLKADFDIDRIEEIEQETRHDVIAFLTAVEEKVGPAARFIHLGCTSSDIVDTANAILLVRAGELILQGIDELLVPLKRLITENKGRLCMGRTHGVHAEPTSFALKLATFYAEFKRARLRFSEALEGMRVGKISGAVGTYAMLSPELEAITCELLGLKVDEISTQIIQRDRHAAYFTSLAILAGGIERFCVELRHLQRTEVLEVEEGFAKGQKGSSAMPHKKNPISAENLSGLARLVRSNSLAAMENQALWHERDISHSSVERVIMPDTTILVDYMLARLATLLENLRVIPKNMDRNLMLSHGLFFSQRVLLALVDSGMQRQEAYLLVQAAAMQSWNNSENFETVVRNNSSISKKLNVAILNEVFDINYYLRHETEILNRVLS